MIPYEFVYELMRAYPGSALLVNKRVVGGRVKNFLPIPNSYKQVIVERGEVKKFQYVEFSIPFLNYRIEVFFRKRIIVHLVPQPVYLLSPKAVVTFYLFIFNGQKVFKKTTFQPFEKVFK